MHSIGTTFLLTTVVVIVVLGVTAAYPTDYDNIDPEKVLNNERLYKRYFNCLMRKGKCTPDAKFLRRKLPSTLATACSKCSQKLKNDILKVLGLFIQKKRSDYKKLAALYDPQGFYRKKFAAEVNKYGVKL
uniref:Chemosensory protein n=2 Tax=Corythucha ciliata TaxID=369451 RepID=A0A2S0M1F2_CORCT|nr:chemosensory protein [Corythucha ciliata]